MNKKSFMAELRSLLAFLDADDRDRVMRRYERMFDDAGTDSEAALIRCFGSPVRQVLQIEREYREATANGEIPFADGADAEENPPEEEDTAEAEDDIAEAAEPLPEEAEEEIGEAADAEDAEISLSEPEAGESPAEEPLPAAGSGFSDVRPAYPAFSVLPDLNLDDLDLTLPDSSVGKAEDMTTLMFGAVEPAEPEEDKGLAEEPLTEEECTSEEPPADALPQEAELDSGESAEDSAAAAVAAIFASMPGLDGTASEESARPEKTEAYEPVSEEASSGESTETEAEAGDGEAEAGTDSTEFIDETLAEYEDIFPEDESEDADTAESIADVDAEEDREDETDRREKPRKPSGGRKFAAVVVTIPMLALWAVLFGLSLVLGILVLALGTVFCMAGIYLAGYVFGGTIVYMPDILLTAGGMLVAFSLAVLLIWSGVSVAITGCSLTVRLTRSIYRSILYPNREEDSHE